MSCSCASWKGSRHARLALLWVSRKALFAACSSALLKRCVVRWPHCERSRSIKTKDELLDECLTALEAGTATLDECIQHYFAADVDAAEALHTIVALRSTLAVPAHEADGARERVRAKISAQTSAAPTTAVSNGARGMSARRSGAGREIGRWRSIALAAAVLLVCALGIWQTLNAAGAALPDSPLYAIKRGTEWIALASAWSDQRRGEVLASIAAQRLAGGRPAAAPPAGAPGRSVTGALKPPNRVLISLDSRMKGRPQE